MSQILSTMSYSHYSLMGTTTTTPRSINLSLQLQLSPRTIIAGSHPNRPLTTCPHHNCHLTPTTTTDDHYHRQLLTLLRTEDAYLQFHVASDVHVILFRLAVNVLHHQGNNDVNATALMRC